MSDKSKSESTVGRRAKYAFREAIFASDLPALTRLVLLVLLEHVRDMAEGCFPGKSRIALMTGMSLRAVDQHIERARLAGWLSVTKRRSSGRHVSNMYRLAVPDHAHQVRTAAIATQLSPTTLHAHLVHSPCAFGASYHARDVRTNPTSSRTFKGESSRAPAREDGCAVGFRVREVTETAVQLVAEHVGADAAIRLRGEFARWPPSQDARDPDALFFAFLKRRNIHVSRRAYRMARRDREQ